MVFVASGTVLLAFGFFRTKSPFHSTAPFALLLQACGIALIASAAIRAGSSWSVRLAILGLYPAIAASLAMMTASLLTRRQAGPVLASLGEGVPRRRRLAAGAGVLIGIPAVAAQYFDAKGPGVPLVLTGLALLLAVGGLHSLLMAKTRWCLSEGGIIGPHVFVPWQQVLACDWRTSDSLAIATKPGFGGVRRLTVPVMLEARDRADFILSRQAPRHWKAGCEIR